MNFFDNKAFIDFLNSKNIELIYIPHHREIFRKKNYSHNIFKSAKLFNQKKLEHYIEQCSLLVTDFSSICFDFYFQYKPVLFYLIDVNDNLKFVEKEVYTIYKNLNNFNILGNVFYLQDEVFEKIKYYVNNNFQIENETKTKYDALFYFKNNIIHRIKMFIEKIISEK